MDMLRIGLLGVTGTLLAVQFKSGKSEYGIYISMDQAYIGTLIKMLGITYISEFASGICKDAGYQTIASQVEIFGKLAVMVLSMPILMTLLNTIREFLT